LKAGCTPTPRELSEGDRGWQQGVLSDLLKKERRKRCSTGWLENSLQ